MEKRAERLTNARKKLRDYQQRRVKNNDIIHASSQQLLKEATDFTIGELEENLAQHERKLSASTVSTVSPVDKHIHCDNTSSGSDKQAGLSLYFDHPENLCLQQAGSDDCSLSTAFPQKESDRDQLLEQIEYENMNLRAQITTLQNQYTELYNAYAELNVIQNGGHIDLNAMQAQLFQLQSAMNVVVRENASLNQQLRETRDLAEQQFSEIEKLSDKSFNESVNISKLNEDLLEYKNELHNLNASFSKQREELESERKEASEFQIKFLRAQQDCNDAQERLKLHMKHSDSLQNEFNEAKKEMKLKELYIQQIGAFSVCNEHDQMSIAAISDENVHLKADLITVKEEVKQWRKEAELARERYEAYGSQLNHNVLQLSTKLEEESNENLTLRSKLQLLEDEMETLLNESNVHLREHKSGVEMEDSSHGKVADNTDHCEQLEVILQELRETKRSLMEKQLENAELLSVIENKEMDLIHKENELCIVNESLQRMRQSVEEHETFNKTARELSDKLQNEKATVSRVVAQNRELKELLIELQDKFVVHSQESMERESSRISALHLVEQLQSRIADLESNKFCIADESSSNVNNVEDVSAVSGVLQLRTELMKLKIDHERLLEENDELPRKVLQNLEAENSRDSEALSDNSVYNRSASFGETPEQPSNVCEIQPNGDDTVQCESVDSSEARGDCVADEKRMISNASVDAELLPILRKPLAWTELEARFTSVMIRNAELLEEKEYLEHIILQLQNENDTIGEYITIYQHQRKVMRERLREREELAAQFSKAKLKTELKLAELQRYIIQVFGKQGFVHKADTKDYPEEALANSHDSVATSQVDVFELANHRNFAERLSNTDLGILSDHNSSCENVVTRIDSEEAVHDHNIKHIMRIITELKDIEQIRTYPSCEVNVLCRECSGSLIVL